MYGGIEAGGTNFVCGVGTGPHDLIRDEFPTRSPSETLERAAAFFSGHKVRALGVGSFGPIDLAAGTITTTPKTAWRQFPLVDELRRTTGIEEIVFDTDVNAAALGEGRWGAAMGLNDFIYLTVGTGIGGGAMVNGHLLHGRSHPEMGHIPMRHDLARDPFAGACYAHGDCLEGLASGFAIEQRWGCPGALLPANHMGWELEAEYLADALAAFTYAFSPAKIIVGGGVMHTLSHAALGERLRRLLNSYVEAPQVVPPALGEDAGLLGAIAMAMSSEVGLPA